MSDKPVAFLSRLQTLLGADAPNALIVDPAALTPYATDQRRRYSELPLAVVKPASVAALQEIVKLCGGHGIAIVPQGGNTGLCGGSVPLAGSGARSVVVALSRLNRVRDLNPEQMCITVEAGMVLHNVQAAARQAGYLFPLSMASEGSCQIGGNIACNAGGLNVVRYGTARALVLGLEAILADGSLISELAPLSKNTTGWNLNQLLIGSEGTLGIITAATLKLFPLPQTRATAWIGLPTAHAAVALLAGLQKHFGTHLESFEWMDAAAAALAAQDLGAALPLQAASHVLIELADTHAASALEEQFAQWLWNNGYTEAVIARTEAERHAFWQLREQIPEAQRRLGASIKHDIAVPVARVPELLQRCQQALHAAFADARIIAFGHLGDGSLHYNVFLPPLYDSRVYKFEQKINELVYREVLALEGTLAAEHGIGQLKTAWLAKIKAPQELAAMRAVKQALDPLGLLNPGKLLP